MRRILILSSLVIVIACVALALRRAPSASSPPHPLSSAPGAAVPVVESPATPVVATPRAPGKTAAADDHAPAALTSAATTSDTRAAAPAKDPADVGYGVMPPLATIDQNPQAASVAEALRTGTHPERLSPMVAPTPWDPVAYAKDSATYLSVSEPGRVWQVAQPGKDVPVLRRLTPRLERVKQGQTVALQVKTVPYGPISVTTMDGGRFAENGLPAITVQADADGIATVTFEATPGVTADVTILAGSPLASGVVRFTVTVGI